jgi:hypothetical protein
MKVVTLHTWHDSCKFTHMTWKLWLYTHDMIVVTLHTWHESCDFTHMTWKLWFYTHDMKVVTIHTWHDSCKFTHMTWELWLYTHDTKVVTLHTWDENWDFSHMTWKLWLYTHGMKVVTLHTWHESCDFSHMTSKWRRGFFHFRGGSLCFKELQMFLFVVVVVKPCERVRVAQRLLKSILLSVTMTCYRATLDQGCQIFLDTIYQISATLPNGHKIYQMAVKYTNIFHPFPSKMNQIWIFCLKIYHLATLPLTNTYSIWKRLHILY